MESSLPPCLTLEGGSSTGVEPVVKVLEKPTAVALSDDPEALSHHLGGARPLDLSNPAFKSQTRVSQHLRYLTLAWRSAVTRCYKAERKVTAATFSSRSNCNFQSPRENGKHSICLTALPFFSPSFFSIWIYTHQQLSQNFAAVFRTILVFHP